MVHWCIGRVQTRLKIGWGFDAREGFRCDTDPILNLVHTFLWVNECMVHKSSEWEATGYQMGKFS